MRTPKKKNPVDLSKCKIGQRFKTRDGKIITFDGKSGDSYYPFQVKETNNLYRRDGGYFISGESKNDIVEVLPLPRRKKAVPLTNIRHCLAYIKACRNSLNEEITRLEGLLK